MNSRPKRLPRLWCALQGLLPFDACLAAQRGELAWPAQGAANSVSETSAEPPPENACTEDETHPEQS